MECIIDEIGGVISDERAVSVTVEHALGIGILLLFSVLLVGGLTSGFTEREEAVVTEEAERIHEEVVNGIQSADQLAVYGERSAGGETRVVTRVATINSIRGGSYSTTIEPTGSGGVTITTVSGGEEITSTINTEKPIEGAVVQDAFKVTYTDSGDDELQVEAIQ
jgi:hypothetical protein